MGQQQLLIIILVVIIVGISTIVALNVLNKSFSNSNYDAIQQDLLLAATNTQQVWERPLEFNGSSRNFDNLSQEQILKRLNISGVLSNGEIENSNARYSITGKTSSEIQITAFPSTGIEEIQMIVCFNSNNSTWLIDIESPIAIKPDTCD